MYGYGILKTLPYIQLATPLVILCLSISLGCGTAPGNASFEQPATPSTTIPNNQTQTKENAPLSNNLGTHLKQHHEVLELDIQPMSQDTTEVKKVTLQNSPVEKEPVAKNNSASESPGKDIQENLIIFETVDSDPMKGSQSIVAPTETAQEISQQPSETTAIPSVAANPTTTQTPQPSWPKAPDFSLPSAQGKQIDLLSSLGDKTTILVFYRAYF